MAPPPHARLDFFRHDDHARALSLRGGVFAFLTREAFRYALLCELIHEPTPLASLAFRRIANPLSGNFRGGFFRK